MKTCSSPLAMRPVLYTDTIQGGHQAMRDDLWAVTTDELNALEAQKADLQESLRAAEQDAARYRYIRDRWQFEVKEGVIKHLNMVVSEGWGAKLDAELDKWVGGTSPDEAAA